MGERLRAVTIGWLTLVGVAVVVVAAIAIAGWFMPAERTVARSTVIAQAPETVWSIISGPDIGGICDPNSPSIDCGSVASTDPSFRASAFRVFAEGRVLDQPPASLRPRWTFVVTPFGTGTRVTLTAEDEAVSPFARCWARLGADQRRIDAALTRLARHFAQSAAIDDAQPDDEEAHAEPPEAVPVR